MSHVSLLETSVSYRGSLLCQDIVNYIYEHPTALDLKMKGFWISDRKHLSPEDITGSKM